MSDILNILNRANNKWAATAQPQVMEANVAGYGSTATTYSVTLKNGTLVSNVEGPANLIIGNAVSLATYPGQTRHYVIIGKAGGGKVHAITTVSV